MVVEEYIGIFQGKKGDYNKLVLKVLYENGCLRAWTIARKIADMKRKPKTNWYQEAQHVQSVLLRKKGGRLKELLEKQYIEKTDRGYCLTLLKGFCTTLTLYKRVEKPAMDPFSENNGLFPEFAKALEIVSQSNPEARLEEKEYELLLSFTRKLLQRGLSFDLLSNRDFNAFFQNEWQLSAFQGLHSSSDEERLEIPDEAKKHIAEGARGLKDALQKQVEVQLKELESIIERYARSIGIPDEGKKRQKEMKESTDDERI